MNIYLSTIPILKFPLEDYKHVTIVKGPLYSYLPGKTVYLGESRCVTFVAVTGMGGGPYPHLHLSEKQSNIP